MYFRRLSRHTPKTQICSVRNAALTRSDTTQASARHNEPVNIDTGTPVRFPALPGRPSLKAFLRLLGGRLRHPNRRDLMLMLAAPPALLVLWVLVLIPFTPGVSDIRKAREEQPAIVLTNDGKPLAEFKRGNRDWVTLEAISPRVIEALIATEDRRFYGHHGIDLRRLAGAALATFQGDTQGGSTITQQLARNLFPEEIGRRQNLNRKIKEAITALKIEAVYSKPQILEAYLNTVPFLYNAYGIDMAARTYFSKSARDLDLLESATLIGMLKGTSYYNPVLNPNRALERRNLVLSLLMQQDKLSTERYEVLSRRPIRLDFERQTTDPGRAAHFTMQLKRWLIDWADRHDYDIYTDGLVVRTTIDSRLQNIATRTIQQRGLQLQAMANGAWAGEWSASNPLVETFVRESAQFITAMQSGERPDTAQTRLLGNAAFLRELRESKTRIETGFIAIDPRNGAIRAWVGGRDFSKDAYDHVHQARRQPGSTFKPFVYGVAFERGMKASDTLIDEAVEISLPDGKTWRPNDATTPTGKPMELRRALAQSRNRIAAQLVQQVGPESVARLARAMGVRESKLEAVPSLALGTSPVSLYEMVSAYATIANTGHYLAPSMVVRIENREGEVLEAFHHPRPERAISAEAEDALLDTMRGVIERGTGTAIRTRYGVRGDLAGKTGTTQDNADGWFILMHPQLVAGAWVGFNDPRITLRSDYWGQGAHSALPIVGEFFARAQAARLASGNERFAQALDETLFGQLGTWYDALFEKETLTEPSQTRRQLPKPAQPASPLRQSESVEALPDAPAYDEPATREPILNTDSAELPASAAPLPETMQSPATSELQSQPETSEPSLTH